MIKEETSWENIHILGRHSDKTGSLDLVWTGSGAEFVFSGTCLGLELEGGSSVYMPWISLFVDGTWIAHIPVQEGIHTYMLMKGMDPFVSHNVRIMKDTQAMPDDPDSFLHIRKILYEGKIAKPENKKYRIEFIGDSITSGEGLLGAKQEMDWISPYFGTADNYAVLTADALNADLRLVSQSGWGLYAAYDNNIRNVMPALYDSTDAVRNAGDYDHSSWSADAVVVNLCTNDLGSFFNPGYTDPDTGVHYKNHVLPDGSFDKDDLKKIYDSVISFLKKIRVSNPHAYILWVYGMCDHEMYDTIEDAVSEYKRSSGDDRAGFLLLDAATDETKGSREHPGPLCHRAASEKISGLLRKELNVAY